MRHHALEALIASDFRTQGPCGALSRMEGAHMAEEIELTDSQSKGADKPDVEEPIEVDYEEAE